MRLGENLDNFLNTKKSNNVTKYAYFITAVQEKTWDRRTFGFYFDLEDAREAVRKNTGGMDECKYDWVVIEKFNEKIWAMGEQIQWYRWCGNNCGWTKYETKPNFALGYINWAIG
jgi:hypothetical protein